MMLFAIFPNPFTAESTEQKGQIMKIMDANEWRKVVLYTAMHNEVEIRHILAPIVRCEDGFEISIQAGSSLYSIPREDGLTEYEAYELGYPNRVEPLLLEYMEEEWYYDGNITDPCKTIYPFTPTEVVNQVIAKHGGITDVVRPKIWTTS